MKNIKDFIAESVIGAGKATTKMIAQQISKLTGLELELNSANSNQGNIEDENGNEKDLVCDIYFVNGTDEELEPVCLLIDVDKPNNFMFAYDASYVINDGGELTLDDENEHEWYNLNDKNIDEIMGAYTVDDLDQLIMFID